MKHYISSKYFAIFFSIVFLACILLPVRVDAAEVGKTYTCGSLFYQVSGESVTITGCFGKESQVEVPASIAGNPVNTIAAGAFTGNTAIKTVILPDSVTKIEEGAFDSAIKVMFADEFSGTADDTDDSEEEAGKNTTSVNPGTNASTDDSEEGAFVEKYAYLDEDEASDDSGKTASGDSDQKNAGENNSGNSSAFSGESGDQTSSGNSGKGSSGKKRTESNNTGNSTDSSGKSGNDNSASSKVGETASADNGSKENGLTGQDAANTADGSSVENDAEITMANADQDEMSLSGITMPVIGILVAVVIAAVIFFVIMMRRKKKK